MPKGDVLVHAGDFCSHGNWEEVRNFCKWLKTLDYEDIVFIAGNHDRAFERDRERALGHIPMKTKTGGRVHYLQDESVTIDGVKFYGSPWQPRFYNWSFNLPRGGKQLEEKWDKIPDNTDVLITHIPPHGILDRTTYPPGHCGCELLYNRVLDVKPKLHVFGHVHEGYGMVHHLLDETIFVNASIVDNFYYVHHKPVEHKEDFDDSRAKRAGADKADSTE